MSGIFVGLDKGITVDSVNAFKSTLNESGIPNEINIYSGVDHVFANRSGERYASDELKNAWNKLSTFLNLI